jgi:hypothetical protein
MPGLGPSIHALPAPRSNEVVDGQDKPGHDVASPTD